MHIAALLLCLVLYALCIKIYTIPSGSNYPTLIIGDYAVVSKLSYAIKEPQPGDLAAFYFKNGDVEYIKRIVGLPGDKIQMRDGGLFINGEPVHKVRLEDFYLPHNEFAPRYRETLPNGVTYHVLDTHWNSPSDNTEEYVVPESSYFVLGDNRDNSNDSRFMDRLGFVKRHDLIGPMIFKFHHTRPQK